MALFKEGKEGETARLHGVGMRMTPLMRHPSPEEDGGRRLLLLALSEASLPVPNFHWQSVLPLGRHPAFQLLTRQQRSVPWRTWLLWRGVSAALGHWCASPPLSSPNAVFPGFISKISRNVQTWSCQPYLTAACRARGLALLCPLNALASSTCLFLVLLAFKLRAGGANFLLAHCCLCNCLFGIFPTHSPKKFHVKHRCLPLLQERFFVSALNQGVCTEVGSPF